ncbi:MAG: hypothetical protein HZB23_09025 [Deltaproteobacteria bacterium]|nr:hypothetical protein [Deltaproteobacteria bacterium]
MDKVGSRTDAAVQIDVALKGDMVYLLSNRELCFIASGGRPRYRSNPLAAPMVFSKQMQYFLFGQNALSGERMATDLKGRSLIVVDSSATLLNQKEGRV